MCKSLSRPTSASIIIILITPTALAEEAYLAIRLSVSAVGYLIAGPVNLWAVHENGRSRTHLEGTLAASFISKDSLKYQESYFCNMSRKRPRPETENTTTVYSTALS